MSRDGTLRLAAAEPRMQEVDRRLGFDIFQCLKRKSIRGQWTVDHCDQRLFSTCDSFRVKVSTRWLIADCGQVTVIVLPTVPSVDILFILHLHWVMSATFYLLCFHCSVWHLDSNNNICRCPAPPAHNIPICCGGLIFLQLGIVCKVPHHNTFPKC